MDTERVDSVDTEIDRGEIKMSKSRDHHKLDDLHVSLLTAWTGDDARMISRQIGILIFGKTFYSVMNSSLLDRA